MVVRLNKFDVEIRFDGSVWKILVHIESSPVHTNDCCNARDNPSMDTVHGVVIDIPSQIKILRCVAASVAT